MSRGWESKMVESQQALHEAAADQNPATSAGQPAARPAATGNRTADAEQRRQRQALELQRERILSERTSNSHRRSALATALIDIEEKLAELGWTVHL